MLHQKLNDVIHGIDVAIKNLAFEPVVLGYDILDQWGTDLYAGVLLMATDWPKSSLLLIMSNRCQATNIHVTICWEQLYNKNCKSQNGNCVCGTVGGVYPSSHGEQFGVISSAGNSRGNIYHMLTDGVQERLDGQEMCAYQRHFQANIFQSICKWIALRYVMVRHRPFYTYHISISIQAKLNYDYYRH